MSFRMPNAAMQKTSASARWPLGGEGVVAPAASVQTVEPHRAAGQDAMLGFGRGADEIFPDHVGGAGEEAVAMRVVGRPHDLVRADIVGQYPQAALDRLEGDPAIAPEQIARPGLQAGIVEPLI